MRRGQRMPRPDRLDFPGAIHYTQVHGTDGAHIFFDPAILARIGTVSRQHAPDLQQFERLIAAVGEECQAVFYGYSVEPNSGVLVLQTIGAPLEAFMRRLCGQYSRYLRLNGRLNGVQSAFAARYESKVIASEYLPHAIRRAHRAPMLSGSFPRRMDYPFSSERAYMGERAVLPLELTAVRKALEQHGFVGARAYREFMDQPEAPYVATLFERGAPLDSRIVGRKLFVKQAKHWAAHPPSPPTREQLILGVARLLNTSETEIFASTHTGVLGRALVAWYGRRTRAATVNTVGQWFSVTRAALGQGIRHYRRIEPDLFNLPELPGIKRTARAHDPEDDGGIDE
jgi:putative transposase